MVEVKTSNKEWAGTDGTVLIHLDRKGKEITLDNSGHDDFERGQYVYI